MVPFLFTAIVLSALIFAGYRLNMYLYSQGAVGVSSRAEPQVQSVVVESSPVQPVRDVQMEERDYGLRYARVGLLIIAGFVVTLGASLLVALFSVLH